MKTSPTAASLPTKTSNAAASAFIAAYWAQILATVDADKAAIVNDVPSYARPELIAAWPILTHLVTAALPSATKAIFAIMEDVLGEEAPKVFALLNGLAAAETSVVPPAPATPVATAPTPVNVTPTPVQPVAAPTPAPVVAPTAPVSPPVAPVAPPSSAAPGLVPTPVVAPPTPASAAPVAPNPVGATPPDAVVPVVVAPAGTVAAPAASAVSPAPAPVMATVGHPVVPTS